MSVKIGNINISKLMLGNSPVKAYLGSVLVYQSGGLPSIYQQVEYLESTGSQYIELNYKATNNTNLEVKFKNTDTTITNYVLGDRVSTSTRRIGLHINTSNGLYLNISSDSSHTGQIAKVVDTSTDIIVIRNGDTYSINGVSGDFPLTDTFECDKNMKVFATSSGTSAIYYGKNKIYYLKMTDTNWSVDLVPCYRKSDNVAGMYDLVNGVFYINSNLASVDDFTLGPDVN